MLTYEELQRLQQYLDILFAHLQARGWAINPQKIQDLSIAVKFLGVTWSVKMHLIQGTVIGKIHHFPTPKIFFLGFLGY